jgi:hypothetical protein
MGLGVEHGLVLPLQAGLDQPVDGGQAPPFPGVPEFAPVDRELAIEQKGDQAIARVLPGIGFAGDQVIDLGQYVGDVEGGQRPLAALLAEVGVVVVLIGGGDSDVIG